MKKLFLFSIFFCICLSLFSCSDNNDPTRQGQTTTVISAKEETTLTMKEKALQNNPNGILTIEPDEFAYCTLFDLPKDFRQAATDYMIEQSSYKWTCSETFKVTKEKTNWFFENTYKKGTEYTGLIYATRRFSLDLFREISKDGYTTDLLDWHYVPGVDCVTSISNSLQKFSPKEYSADLFWVGNAKCNVKKVGDYQIFDKMLTRQIAQKNGSAKMNECYAKLQPGDIVSHYNETTHSRMVHEVHIEYKKLDPTAIEPRTSYILCLEQTDQFDKTRKDGVLTNWYIDHKYTFSDLYSGGYMPLTLEEYEIGTSEIPYITLDEKQSMLEKGALSGTLKSNYPLRYTVIELFDKDGNSVKRIQKDDFASAYSYTVRAQSLNIFENVPNGDYKLVIKAGITPGTATLVETNFTLNR